MHVCPRQSSSYPSTLQAFCERTCAILPGWITNWSPNEFAHVNFAEMIVDLARKHICLAILLEFSIVSFCQLHKHLSHLISRNSYTRGRHVSLDVSRMSVTHHWSELGIFLTRLLKAARILGGVVTNLWMMIFLGYFSIHLMEYWKFQDFVTHPIQHAGTHLLFTTYLIKVLEILGLWLTWSEMLEFPGLLWLTWSKHWSFWDFVRLVWSKCWIARSP